MEDFHTTLSKIEGVHDQDNVVGAGELSSIDEEESDDSNGHN